MADADSDPDQVAAAREEVIDAMARAAQVYGIKQSYGRLFGQLYFADEPLSLDELAERTDYAKSTVSTAMSAMEGYHLVHRRSLPGEGKKAYFEAERDFWHVFQQFLAQEVTSEIRIMSRALDDALETLEDADSEQARADREKIERLRDVYSKSERAISLLTSTSLDRLVSALKRLG